jgi:hypothetical protein
MLLLLYMNICVIFFLKISLRLMHIWKLTLDFSLRNAPELSSNYLYVDFEVVPATYCIAEGKTLPLYCI